jgi:hypothetical protein
MPLADRRCGSRNRAGVVLMSPRHVRGDSSGLGESEPRRAGPGEGLFGARIIKAGQKAVEEPSMEPPSLSLSLSLSLSCSEGCRGIKNSPRHPYESSLRRLPSPPRAIPPRDNTEACPECIEGNPRRPPAPVNLFTATYFSYFECVPTLSNSANLESAILGYRID